MLTFRFSGPWIRLRGEVDAAGNVRLIATNHGRIAGYISLLGVGTPCRDRRRLRRDSAFPVEPEIQIEGFAPAELKVGQMKVWRAAWPEGGAKAGPRTRSSKVARTRRVDPGSRAVRVYATVNGRFRTGRITWYKDAVFS